MKINIDDEKIKAVSETDVDRTSEEGKASSVQFLHFHFSLKHRSNLDNKK